MSKFVNILKYAVAFGGWFVVAAQSGLDIFMDFLQ